MNQSDREMSGSHGALKLIEGGLKRWCRWGACSACSISDVSKQGTFMVLRSTGGERFTGKIFFPRARLLWRSFAKGGSGSIRDKVSKKSLIRKGKQRIIRFLKLSIKFLNREICDMR